MQLDLLFVAVVYVAMIMNILMLVTTVEGETTRREFTFSRKRQRVPQKLGGKDISDVLTVQSWTSNINMGGRHSSLLSIQ